jgi:hypothetical protein
MSISFSSFRFGLANCLNDSDDLDRGGVQHSRSYIDLLTVDIFSSNTKNNIFVAMTYRWVRTLSATKSSHALPSAGGCGPARRDSSDLEGVCRCRASPLTSEPQTEGCCGEVMIPTRLDPGSSATQGKQGTGTSLEDFGRTRSAPAADQDFVRAPVGRDLKATLKKRGQLRRTWSVQRFEAGSGSGVTA